MVAVLAALAALTGCSASGHATRAQHSPPAVRSPSVTATAHGSATATASSTATAAPSADASRPCGSVAKPPDRYTAVVWIWLENQSLPDLAGMPYLSGVARACALATDYHAITHPSLPNYLAAVSGSTGGVHSDCSPGSCPQRRTTLFDQVRSSGREWRAYQEAMPHNCARSSSGRYAPKHNPAVYFTQLAADCALWDVPLDPAFDRDVVNGRLPTFSFVTPDLCHDGHDCGVATVDGWLRGWLPKLLDGPDYRRGRTAVFVTWDESELGGGNRVATVVLAPSVRPGTRAGGRFTHYSLLRTTEELLGLPPIAAAVTAAGMRGALHI
jgi:hypothetical protein